MSGYWMRPDGDDDYDDNGGGFDDNQPDEEYDDQPQEDDQSNEEQPEDDDQQDDEDQPVDGDGSGDGNGDDEPTDEYPDATPEDFEDDTGDWTPEDYEDSAQNLFGQHEFFGDTLTTQLTDQGYEPFDNPAFRSGFERLAPGSSDTVHLFQRDGTLVAFGFLTVAALAALRQQYRSIDLSNVEIAVPPKGEAAEPQPLPPDFSKIREFDSVDLRKYCSPVGDQGQTSRCSAFAWTHGVEMARNILFEESQLLSANFTMLQFQIMQGEARDYAYAYQGGDGTVGGPDPGKVMTQRGTCRAELWPDADQQPRAQQHEMEADAAARRLDAIPLPIALEDVRKVLSAGCPVHVSINTGSQFSKVGRDGLFNAAEKPSGQHGRHAMLIVGYVGNFYIIKNSWGTEWGDKGYLYIPKPVLAASDPEFIAILLRRPPQ